MQNFDEFSGSIYKVDVGQVVLDEEHRAFTKPHSTKWLVGELVGKE